MDIIAEILETDRLAEEKLAEAEKKRAAMLENLKHEQERLGSITEEDNAGYAAALAEENEHRLSEELRELEGARDKEAAALENVFKENGNHWADEIFERIVGSIRR